MIPTIVPEGYSRTVQVNVVNRLEVRAPEIYIDRTYVLQGEEITVKWRASKYYTRIKAQLSKYPDFSVIEKTLAIENPLGSSLGIYGNGQLYVRAEWDTSSLVKPKG